MENSVFLIHKTRRIILFKHNGGNDKISKIASFESINYTLLIFHYVQVD